MRALLCVGKWSQLGFIKSDDISKVTSKLPDVVGDEGELADGWDSIGTVSE